MLILACSGEIPLDSESTTLSYRLDHSKITTYSDIKVIQDGLEEVPFISLKDFLMMSG